MERWDGDGYTHTHTQTDLDADADAAEGGWGLVPRVWFGLVRVR
jgi:hypothetical protein